MVTPEQLETLEEQDKETLAVWWCILNHHNWPRGLSRNDIPDTNNSNQTWGVMSWICQKITMKECLRVWNAERMSREEFEKKWDEWNGMVGKNS